MPRDDTKRFRHWVETATGVFTPAAAREEANGQLNDYVIGLIADRRAAARDDLLSDLVRATDDEDRLNEAELLGLITSLLAGGFETTAWQLGATAHALMDHQEHWRQPVDDPELVPNALEELWRWIPSFKYGTNFVRWASSDVELGQGALVRAGEAILPEQAVANRDEAVFPHGWELDFHRADPRPHLSLGFGEHYCMGARGPNPKAPVRSEAQDGGHRISVHRQQDVGEQHRAVAQRYGDIAPLLDAVGAATQVVPGSVFAPQLDAECADECAHGRVVAKGLRAEIEVDPARELVSGIAVRIGDGDPGDEIEIGAEALQQAGDVRGAVAGALRRPRWVEVGRGRSRSSPASWARCRG